MRKRLDHLDAALDQNVGPAAVVAGDAADQDAERKADRDPDQPDRQRNAGAVDDAREQVAAEPVGAEQEQIAALGRADEVKIALEQAPELVAVTMAEEADRLRLRKIRLIHAAQLRHVEMVALAVDEWPDQAAMVED